MSKDYYEILGVDRNADKDQIKTAFRSLSKRYHPDVCKDEDAAEKFKDINEAYHVLSDDEKRRNYDMFGDPEGGNLFDMDPFGMFGNLRGHTERGTDLRITISLTLAEAYEGVHKKIKLKKNCTCHRCHGSGSDDNSYKACPTCGGTGYKRIRSTTKFGYSDTVMPCPECNGAKKVAEHPCTACGGTGLESGEKEIEFDVPAGMPFDAYFVVNGAGNDAPHRGVPGNLIVIATQSEEDKKNNPLTRDGNDLLYTLKVDYAKLVEGCDVSVPYVKGEQKIHLPEGTESGTVISLFRKGFPDPNNPKSYGNYKITVECIIPKMSKLSEKQREALNKYSDTF